MRKLVISKLWFATAAAVLCVQAVVAFYCPDSFGLRIFGNLIQCGLLVSCYLSTLPIQVSGSGAGFWTLTSIGFALWLVMQAVWTLYETVLRKPVPDMFWGDVILFAHTIPIMMAFAMGPHVQQRRDNARVHMANAGLMLGWWAYLYLYFVIAWQFVVRDLDLYNRNFNIVYGAANVGVAALAVISWLRSRGAWRNIYAHWVGAACLYIVASYVASAAIDRGEYYTGGLYDVPLSGALAWFAGIGLIARDTTPETTTHAAERRSSRSWGAWLAFAAIFFIPCAEMWQLFVSRVPPTVNSYRLSVTLGATGVLSFLFALRERSLGKTASIRTVKIVAG